MPVDYSKNRDLTVVNENGDIIQIYPTTNAMAVIINTEKNNAIASSIITLQQLIDKLGSMAFSSDVSYKDLKNIVTTSESVTETGYLTDATVVCSMNDRLKELENTVADLQYEPIAIKSMSINPNVMERGARLTSVTISFSLNKLPSVATLNDTAIDVNSINFTKTYTNLNIIGNENNGWSYSWKLIVKDERSNNASKSVTINFLNNIFYGISEKPSRYNKTFLDSLSTKILSDTKERSITVNPSENQYIYYCFPQRLGEPKFNIGGFEGGLHLEDTIDVINSSGYSETYYIYQSDYPNLGITKIDIS